MAYNILLVDDDQTQIKVLETVIRDKMKYNTSLVLSGKEAVDILTTDQAKNIDLVLLDLSMPGVDGIDVLKAVKPVHPNLPIIVRTGYDDTDLVIKAMKAGATDFVKKIDDNERLETSINNALRLHVLNDELSRLKRSMSHHVSFDDIIGQSARRNEVVRLGQKVAQSNIPVLIEGDSGVGKELLARAVHDASDRNEKPFIAVNCGAIPENLVESTLFGHEKGSFTGAMYKSYGKFREAEGGTLFLDEVGELKPDIQVKLLRALQDGEIQPVGSDKTAKVNVRIISATNRNLSEEVSKGYFREDLFYRLNVFPIYVPALKERKDDIPLLIDFYFKKFAEAEGKNIEQVTPEAKTLLQNYHWLGNIRQLKNVLFRAVVLCDEKQLDVHDFPQLLESDLEAMSQHASRIHDGAGFVDIFDEEGDIKALNDIEQQIIKLAIYKYNGHMCEVARKLDIGRSTLYRKLDDLGIDHAKLKKKSKPKPVNNSTASAFTLVELAIVLVIIGLLVSGVFAGQTLLRSAELRGVVSQIDNYKISIDQFVLQYDAFPGDLNNGWDYWGTDCAVDAGTCNGNNNDQIGVNDEQFIAWRQLVLARLIGGNFSGSGPNTAVGTNVPRSNDINAGIGLNYKSTTGLWVDKRGRVFARNNLILANDTGIPEVATAVLSTDDAYYIDQKFDDGQPDFGWILAENGSGTTGCTTAIGPANADYNFTQTGLRCRMYFHIEN